MKFDALCWMSDSIGRLIEAGCWSGLKAIQMLAQVEDNSAQVGPTENSPSTATGALFEFLASPINLILISAILYMFIVARPQQKKQQDSPAPELKKNDRVVTASGIHGIVVQVYSQDGLVIIRIDENTGARMTINRDVITQIFPTDSKE